MMELPIADGQLAAVIGLVGGIGLGLAARLGRFCTLGAIEDQLYGGSDHRLRMWGMAIGVSVILVFLGIGSGLIETSEASYLGAGGWNPIAHILGGLVFGFGMAWAGNCGYGALARLGGGDLRSFVIVVVMGISAYVVMSGPLAQIRVTLFPQNLVETDVAPGIAHGLAAATGLQPMVWGVVAGLAVLIATLSSKSFRSEPAMIAWGVVIGLVIGGTWMAMQWASTYSFGAVRVENHTFAGPLGETILYAMTSSGGSLTFAVGAVVGVWTGALIGSLIKGHFRWEACEDPRELRRQIFGAGMMGAGAVLAVGCSVGQGLSAMSLLTYGAPLTSLSIYAGAALGLRSLISGWLPA